MVIDERDNLWDHAPGIGECLLGERVTELVDSRGTIGDGTVAKDGGERLVALRIGDEGLPRLRIGGLRRWSRSSARLPSARSLVRAAEHTGYGRHHLPFRCMVGQCSCTMPIARSRVSGENPFRTLLITKARSHKLETLESPGRLIAPYGVNWRETLESVRRSPRQHPRLKEAE